MCAPSSNCSHQSAHNTTSFVYVLLFPTRLLFLLDRPCRDGPPFTYFSRHFVPGYGHIVPAGTALPFTHFSRHFVPGYCHIVPAGTAHLSLIFPGTSYRATVTSSPAETVPHFNEKSFNLASNRWRSVSRVSAALLVSVAIATHRSINPSRSLISTYSASIRESGVQLW